MVKVNDKQKHSAAGTKAWKTIRSERRKKGAMKTSKITSYTVNEEKTTQQIENSWKGNRIVMPFDKTPVDIACGRFWEIRWAYGCPFNCSYCFLRGTMRGRMKPQFVRTELVLQAIDEAFAKIHVPSIFNAGELSDSLMNPVLMQPIIDRFEEQSSHKIYLLSKCGPGNAKFLTDKLRKQVICGWSINALNVAKRWEPGAASPEDRIKAAALVSNYGYDTRVRIDPIFPIDDWKSSYSHLIDLIFSQFTPNRIILGTPRGLWKTIHYAIEARVDTEWLKFFEEDSSWGKKLLFNRRKEIYEFIFNKLQSLGYDSSRISLCKETTDMWKSLNLQFNHGICNCYSSKVIT